VLECTRALLLVVLGMERRAVGERAEEVDDALGADVVRPAARVTCHVHGQVRAAVVAAVAGEHLAPTGVQPRHAHRVLDRLSARIGEEDVLQRIAGRVLGDQAGGLAADVVGVLRRDGAQPRRLLLDGGHHRRVLVADVGVDQLAGEVEQGASVAVPHPAALRRGDHHRVEGTLGRPGVEDVRAVIGVRAGHCVRIDDWAGRGEGVNVHRGHPPSLRRRRRTPGRRAARVSRGRRPGR